MESDESEKSVSSERHQRSEAEMKRGGVLPPAYRGDDVERLIHDLEVRQVELEVQNDELRRAKVELAESHRRYHGLFNHAPVGYLTLDRFLRVTEANLTLAALVGVARAELVGRSFTRFMPEPSAKAFHACLNDAFLTGVERSVDVRLETRGDRSLLAVHIDLVCFTDERGVRSECRAAVLDLSKLMPAERGLHSATVLDTVADAIVCSDASGRIEAFNRAAERLFGYARAEVLGKNVRLLFPAPYRDEQDLYLQRHLSTREARILGTGSREVTGLKKNGTTFPLELGIGEWVEGDEHKFVTVLHDLTKRQRTESELRESEERFRSIFEYSGAGIAISRPDGTLSRVNPALAHFLGYRSDELEGKSFMELTHPDDVEETRQLLEEFRTGKRTTGNFQKRYVRKDATTVWGNMTATWVCDDARKPLYGIAMIQDITERKRTEEANRLLTAQSYQTQKLEALGTLASGVAHDFSNLLMGIGGCTNIALSYLPADSSIRMYLEEIKNSAESGAAISKRLLDFTRKRSGAHFQVLEVDRLIKRVRNLFARMLTEDIELAVRLEAGTSRVRADPGLVEQVLVNLAANARDAMPNGGRLTFETKNVQLIDNNSYGLPAGDYVLLTVSDTGMGMDSHTRERVFEPFFTTKEGGKGTGLGLSMVHGIIEQVGGKIWMKSAPQRGSSFEIFLPVTSALATHDSDPPPEDTSSLAGTGTVLVVEDDRAVRLGTRFYLEQAGYRVLEAGSGPEAIACCSNFRKPIDLLLSDVVLPGMNGSEIAQQVRVPLQNLYVPRLADFADDFSQVVANLATQNRLPVLRDENEMVMTLKDGV